MLELLFCALLTVLPDYLIKRFIYKKRWGREINFYTVWYELRWGITFCVLLTITLITIVFYYHPSTKNVTSMFRTVTILPETPGRVDQVFIENHEVVEAGDPLFRMDSSRQEAAVNVAESSLNEVKAAFGVAQTDLVQAEGAVASAESQLAQAEDDLSRKLEISAGGADLISEQDVETARNRVSAMKGQLETATAVRAEARVNIDTILPAKQKTAEDALEQAQVELEKTTIYASISGRVTQLVLQPGDIVNPLLRPAGLLVPEEFKGSGHLSVQAGFNQLSAQIVKVGTLAEMTCMSKPFTVIPMVVAEVQSSIASGQLRPTDMMVDLQDRARPGTLTARLEPLYEGGLDGVIPGSKCIANVYTNNHELIATNDLDTGEFLFYHMVDTVGLVHALILRIQALLLPVKGLVFAGH